MKKCIENLALFGGKPALEEDLYVNYPNTGDRQNFLRRVNDIFDRRWFTNRGCYVRELEQRIAEYLGQKHCILTCNGTTALEITTRALELTGEIIIPSFTFVATAHALQWQGITPVFCDIDPSTHQLDPGKVEALLTPRTKGICGVHLWGRTCDVEALNDIAQRHGLKLYFDASHAFGCSHKQQMVGGFGEAEIFSFHATKYFQAFEGGAILTNDDMLSEKIRLMINFGFAGENSVIHLGINGKMSEVSAAMGLTSLESINQFIEVNRRNYELYQERLAPLAGLRLLPHDESERNNYQYVVIEIDAKQVGLARQQVKEILEAERVMARSYFSPGCHRMEPYRSLDSEAGLKLPETEGVCERVLVLPTGTSIEPSHIDRICDVIRFSLENVAAITDCWPNRGYMHVQGS